MIVSIGGTEVVIAIDFAIGVGALNRRRTVKGMSANAFTINNIYSLMEIRHRRNTF